jgi:hypothetical protein
VNVFALNADLKLGNHCGKLIDSDGSTFVKVEVLENLA